MAKPILIFSAAADPGSLNDGLGSTYRIGFSCPKKWGHLFRESLKSDEISAKLVEVVIHVPDGGGKQS
jgi:hypothetical protein